MKETAKFQFSNVVVVEKDFIGVIVKSWKGKNEYNHDVYVRTFNTIINYQEDDIKHFVHSKELSENEYEFYL